jgi:hypothetical protein
MEAQAYAERYRQVMSIEQTKNSLIEVIIQLPFILSLHIDNIFLNPGAFATSSRA